MTEPDGDLAGYYAPDPPIVCMLPAPEPPQDTLARLRAAAARAEGAAKLTDIGVCRIAHSGRASGLREALRIIGEEPAADANNPAASMDAANNPLREQYAAIIRRECGSQFEYVTEQLLAIHRRDTAQLRRERYMALKAAEEARAADRGSSVGECRDADRRWEHEKEGS